MEKFKQILEFCNFLDSEGRLSLTNLSMVSLVGKMVVAGAVDWPSVVAVITVMGNYMHKRSIVAKSESESAG